MHFESFHMPLTSRQFLSRVKTLGVKNRYVRIDLEINDIAPLPLAALALKTLLP